MTKQKDRITSLLEQIGACWAVTMDKCVLSDDSIEDQMNNRTTYHIHPDQSHPHVNSIQRFTSLKKLEAWIKEQRPAGWRTDKSHWQRTNISLPSEWAKELKRRDGSLQAAIERLVRDELGSFS